MYIQWTEHLLKNWVNYYGRQYIHNKGWVKVMEGHSRLALIIIASLLQYGDFENNLSKYTF